MYGYPTIAKLAALASTTASASVTNGHANGDATSRVAALEAMVAKYTASFPAPASKGKVGAMIARFTQSAPPKGKVFLVTGTTGGLGSNLLALLLKDGAVEKVYAVNRAGAHTLAERHASGFADRGLDVELLKSPKLHLVEATTSKPKLGLADKQYDEVRRALHDGCPASDPMW